MNDKLIYVFQQLRMLDNTMLLWGEIVYKYNIMQDTLKTERAFTNEVGGGAGRIILHKYRISVSNVCVLCHRVH